MPIDYKDYPFDWLTRIRPDILERDNYSCQFCKAFNYQSHPITGSKVVLTIAHLDHNKENCKYENLAALCQRCHLRHDIKQHIANRKYGRKHKDSHQLKLDI